MSFSRVVILQLVILSVVLESDLGTKKLGWFRIARPIIAGVLIVPFFLKTFPTTGHDLTLQGIGALAGVGLGLFCVSPPIVAVFGDPDFRGWWARRRHQPGRPAAVSQSGAAYATIWISVSLARLAFSYLSQHAFPHALGVWLVKNHLAPDALTNALVFLALGMDVFRSVGLVARGAGALREGRIQAGVSQAS